MRIPINPKNVDYFLHKEINKISYNRQKINNLEIMLSPSILVVNQVTDVLCPDSLVSGQFCVRLKSCARTVQLPAGSNYSVPHTRSWRFLATLCWVCMYTPGN